jgi:hypothetical protein
MSRTRSAGEKNLTMLSVRVPRDVPSRLMLAAAQRKCAGLKPCTQQDIIVEALTAWFKTHEGPTLPHSISVRKNRVNHQKIE